jgi:glycosyltransferase involved in cell wall biosynthesis
MKISIITPSYNSGKFIEDAIKSVLEQDYPDFEHIIIDGGSTDNTIEILNKYPHLIWISEPDTGQSNAMNKGFQLSTGHIIGYLNADDYYLPGAFNDIIPHFNSGEKFVVGKINVISEDGSSWINDPKTDFIDMLKHWEPEAFCVNPVGYFYRREVQEAVGGFNENNHFAMDLEFLLDSARVFELKKINVLMGVFRYFKNTKTAISQKEKDVWTQETFNFIEKHLQDKPINFLRRYKIDRKEGYLLRKKWQYLEFLNEFKKRQNKYKKTNKILFLKYFLLHNYYKFSIKIKKTGFLQIKNNISNKYEIKENPKGVSVVLCTYNGSSIISNAIEHLNNQEVSDIINWEVIIVDNASTDNTAEVVLQVWNRKDVCLKIVNEEKKGLSYARHKGISEAKYEYISFIDDDNWVDSKWVDTVYDVFENKPEAGIIGGQVEEVCEVTPPSWFNQIKSHYAVGKQATESSDLTDTRGYLWGAGLNIRKSSLEEIIQAGFNSFLTGRKGKKVLAGEDSEICHAFKFAGWRLWYDERLKLKHYITKKRFEWDYVEKMFLGFGYSYLVLGTYNQFYQSGGKISLYKLLRNHWKVIIGNMLKLSKFIYPKKNRIDNIQYLYYQFYKGYFSSLIFSLKNYKKIFKKIKNLYNYFN